MKLDKGTYLAGDTLSGTVYLKAKDQESIKYFTVRVRCEALVRIHKDDFFDRYGVGNGNYHKEQEPMEKWHNETLYTNSCEIEDYNQVFGIGTHALKFGNIPLPVDTPPSCYDKVSLRTYGKIVYTVKVFLGRDKSSVLSKGELKHKVKFNFYPKTVVYDSVKDHLECQSFTEYMYPDNFMVGIRGPRQPPSDDPLSKVHGELWFPKYGFRQDTSNTLRLQVKGGSHDHPLTVSQVSVHLENHYILKEENFHVEHFTSWLIQTANVVRSGVGMIDLSDTLTAVKYSAFLTPDFSSPRHVHRTVLRVDFTAQINTPDGYKVGKCKVRADTMLLSPNVDVGDRQQNVYQPTSRSTEQQTIQQNTEQDARSNQPQQTQNYIPERPALELPRGPPPKLPSRELTVQSMASKPSRTASTSSTYGVLTEQLASVSLNSSSAQPDVQQQPQQVYQQQPQQVFQQQPQQEVQHLLQQGLYYYYQNQNGTSAPSSQLYTAPDSPHAAVPSVPTIPMESYPQQGPYYISNNDSYSRVPSVSYNASEYSFQVSSPLSAPQNGQSNSTYASPTSANSSHTDSNSMRIPSSASVVSLAPSSRISTPRGYHTGSPQVPLQGYSPAQTPLSEPHRALSPNSPQGIIENPYAQVAQVAPTTSQEGLSNPYSGSASNSESLSQVPSKLRRQKTKRKPVGFASLQRKQSGPYSIPSSMPSSVQPPASSLVSDAQTLPQNGSYTYSMTQEDSRNSQDQFHVPNTNHQEAQQYSGNKSVSNYSVNSENPPGETAAHLPQSVNTSTSAAYEEISDTSPPGYAEIEQYSTTEPRSTPLAAPPAPIFAPPIPPSIPTTYELPPATESAPLVTHSVLPPVPTSVMRSSTPMATPPGSPLEPHTVVVPSMSQMTQNSITQSAPPIAPPIPLKEPPAPPSESPMYAPVPSVRPPVQAVAPTMRSNSVMSPPPPVPSVSPLEITPAVPPMGVPLQVQHSQSTQSLGVPTEPKRLTRSPSRRPVPSQNNSSYPPAFVPAASTTSSGPPLEIFGQSTSPSSVSPVAYSEQAQYQSPGYSANQLPGYPSESAQMFEVQRKGTQYLPAGPVQQHYQQPPPVNNNVYHSQDSLPHTSTSQVSLASSVYSQESNSFQQSPHGSYQNPPQKNYSRRVSFHLPPEPQSNNPYTMMRKNSLQMTPNDSGQRHSMHQGQHIGDYPTQRYSSPHTQYQNQRHNSLHAAPSGSYNAPYDIERPNYPQPSPNTSFQTEGHHHSPLPPPPSPPQQQAPQFNPYQGY